jgi:organic radical activating enzyme
MQILDPIPDTRILSLLLTLQCTAECKHCGTQSSPRVKSRLNAEVARSLIRQAKVLDYHLIAFTGGEAMLYGPELFELIQLASTLGMPTRLVTNAFWASSRERAAETLAKLKVAGLKEINFSTGDQHMRFISIENIGRAVRASLDARLSVAVMIEVVDDNKISRQTLISNPLFSTYVTPEEIESLTFCESPWMSLDENELLKYPPGLTTNSQNLALRTGCDSVINTTTVLADGRIMACCGLGTQTIPELEVGNVNVDDIKTVRARSEGDFLKRWIRAEGPERILAWAAGKDASIQWENQYAHRCQACKRIYSDSRVRELIEHFYEEKVLDVLVTEWLMHGFVPSFEQEDTSHAECGAILATVGMADISSSGDQSEREERGPRVPEMVPPTPLH